MLLCFSVVAEAQTQSDAFLQYRQRQAAAANAYKQRQEEALQSYKDKRRKAYAEYMRKKWEAFNIEFPEVQPLRPEPVEPVVKPIEEEATAPKEVIEEVAAPEEVVIEEVTAPEEVVEEVAAPEEVVEEVAAPEEEIAPEEIVEEAAEEVIEEVAEPEVVPVPVPEPEIAPEPEPAPAPEPEPEPLPIPESEPIVVGEGMTLSFFGAECSITLTEAHRFKLRSIYEKDVAAAWESLNNSNFDSYDFRIFFTIRKNLSVFQCIIVTILYHKDFHFARGKPIFSTDFYGNVYRSASLKARMVASRVV